VAWIELDGAVNVRDLGGLPTDDGGKTADARLLRGENLQELSPADIATLVGEIGLTTVVDLRSSDELASEGPAPLDDVAGVLHVHHPVLPEAGSATDAAGDVLLTRADRDRSRYPADPICGHYLGYLEDRPDQVVGAVRSIACDGGAALVHCAAGKDRTGVWPVTDSATMTCSCSAPNCSAPERAGAARVRHGMVPSCVSPCAGLRSVALSTPGRGKTGRGKTGRGKTGRGKTGRGKSCLSDCRSPGGW